MQVVVKLKRGVTGRRKTAAARGEIPDELQRIVRAFGEALEPLHAASADPTLARYCVIDVRDPRQVHALIPALLRSPLVDAAYAKPSDALP